MSEENTAYLNYLEVKKNKVELKDSFLGLSSPIELEYQEAVMSNDFSYYDPTEVVYSMYFEVDTVSTKVARKIWNFSDALGWAGGIMSIVAFLIYGFVGPFIANNVAIAITAATPQGQQLDIASYKFYIRKAIEHICSCGCTKLRLRKSAEYSQQIEYFDQCIM